eukprot:TRINITY_DN19440_c0_g1_i1.p1 TRINITY_DN19440_c0_g1~~TRINITY_DN19440_c0_g1_i1.p1  ORF type:complete len:370 (+),score=116.08 TRINITY_DN19440_c0_g1_i1:83-1111(+)
MALQELGYKYVPGPSGDPSDLVLRQIADPEKGFEWSGQEHYDKLGAAVVAHVKGMLQGLCGLEPLRLPPGGGGPAAVVHASPGATESQAPLLLLVCGSAPGGAAGVWGRSLCVNATLRQGAMFDYVRRAREKGWSVIVADPNVNEIEEAAIPGSECPHKHVRTLWEHYVEPAKASKVLVVAHSYGGPQVANLLKTTPSARERIAAIAFTDAGAFDNAGDMLQEAVPSDASVAAAKKPAAAAKERDEIKRFAEIEPSAFLPPPEEAVRVLREVARNWVSSAEPLGKFISPETEGVLCVSAGHESHPSTTFSATEEVFAFLQCGVEGTAAADNARIRQSAASSL